MDGEQHIGNEQEFYQLYLMWRGIVGHTFRRRFLEAHPRLVGPELAALITLDSLRQDEEIEVLQQIRQYGGSKEAIQEVFVDRYGALVLDLPHWLEEVRDRYDDLYYDRPPLQTVDERVSLLREAILRGADDENVAPEMLADLYNKLALALKEHPLLDRSEAIESAITLYMVSLQIFQLKRYPRQWAIHLSNLGTAYTYRIMGEHWRNREKAISCFTAVLRVYTLEDFPQQYAKIMMNLGKMYQKRIRGKSHENIESWLKCLLAVLHVRTRQAALIAHASVLYDLGQAYQQRPLGSLLLNREKAICCYEVVLQIYVDMDSFAGQARVLNSLGDVYQERLVGNRRDNQQKAFQYFKQALTIYTQERMPLKWASILINLGTLYGASLLGARRDNLEEAINCYTKALQVFSSEHTEESVKVLINLGNIYRIRIMEDRRTNLEKAITYLTQALQMNIKERSPAIYASIQNNLGGVYGELGQMPGKRSDYIEAAILAFTEALQIYTLEDFPADCAMVQGNLGTTYLLRLVGDPAENQTHAITYFEMSLQLYNAREYPLEYAAAQNNLGLIYWHRIQGDRRKNLATALKCHRKSLKIHTLEDFPVEYRNAHLNIASLVYEQMIPDAQRTGRKQSLFAACAFAHRHYALARKAQQMLGWLESDEQGRASLQGFYSATRDMYTREAWCLWMLGKLSDAALVLESGRVQALVESQVIAGAVLSQVCTVHAIEFEAARQELQLARLEGDRMRKRVARDEFQQSKQAIQAHCQHNFLADSNDYQEISNAATDQALIYLATSLYGGFILLIPPASDSAIGAERPPLALSLPDLTWERVDEWIVTHAQQAGVTGGYKFALRRQGVELLLLWLTAGDDQEIFEQKANTPFNQLLDLLPDPTTILHQIVADTLSLLTQASEGANEQEEGGLKQALQFSLDTWLVDETLYKLLQQSLSWSLQKREIASLLGKLSTTIMEPLWAWLDEPGFPSRYQRLAFIPCGRLGIFPLHAAPIGPEQLPFAEMYEMTYQASARSLAALQEAARGRPTRGPILALGSPQHEGKTTLPCAEAEVEAIVRLVDRTQSLSSVYLHGARGVKGLFLKKLAEFRLIPGAWLHIASHGSASVNDPHESYMELSGYDAKGRKARLSLATLQRERLLLGFWGVTASGCVTGLVDLDIAPDELGSFAAGLLQAGAVCVVATLWPVHDHATALLMIRFHQLYRSNLSLSAAGALRDAVRWLRTATHEQLNAFAHEWRLPEVSLANPIRDAIRGSEISMLSEKGLGEKNALLLPFESMLDTDEVLFPYNHPVYWASPIIYGV